MSLLLQKITELHDRPGAKTLLDADLMLDYIRILYANTLEWRDELAQKAAVPPVQVKASAEEPAAQDNEPVQEEQTLPVEEPAPVRTEAAPPPRPMPTAPPRPTPTAPPRHRATTLPEPTKPESAKPVATQPVPQPAAMQPAPPPQAAPQPAALPPRPEFQQTLGINDRLLVMNELFAGSGDNFRDAMRLINESVDYHQAAGRLHEATGLIHDEDDMNSDLFFGLLRRYFAQHAHSK